MTSGFSEQTYKNNLAILEKSDPLLAAKLENLNITQNLSICETVNGQPNLCLKKYGLTLFYHSPTDLETEFKEMIIEDVQKNGETLFIYGLGLGYIFDHLESWLAENPNRTIIFLEDDLEVIYYFLHTKRATKILQHPKSVLFHFTEYSQDQTRFIFLLTTFAGTKTKFTVLPAYLRKNQEKAISMCYRVLYDSSLMEGVMKEHLSGQSGFYTNFFRNIFYLNSSYLGTGLFGKFKNIPAIICGAGPSLQKNIHLLKSLNDKAVIFAGGSSLNVLNSFGIHPHFGSGVDPNKEQKHRLFSNDSFHLPYLFRPRVSHDAFTLMQGPKIYIPGSVNPTASWFENELGISIPLLDEGHNVVNLCTEIAYRMGLNPIIYVGMDLAFTEIQTYASGILTHPLWVDVSRPYGIQEKESILRQDIYGNQVKTKWDWIGEASWLSHFALNHPDIKLINATEGGIGFPPIPNMTLQNVAGQYMDKTYDLTGKVHTEIQNHPIRTTTPELMNLLTTLKASLDKCANCYREILKEKTEILHKRGKPIPEFDSLKSIFLESEIESEIGYQTFLKTLDNAYSFMQQISHLYKKINVSDFFVRLARFKFLATCLATHINILGNSFRLYLANYHPQAVQKNKPQESRQAGSLYQFENGRLQIHEGSLDIDIDISIPKEAVEKQTQQYENGQLQAESFYFENQLHGPSRFYSPSGQLLSESWYVKNSQEGKSIQYYASGALYSVRHFKNNLLHGPQIYYFENGLVSVSMNYEKGFHEGDVDTFADSGQQLRQLHYHKGKRHGIEKMWNPNGQLVVECSYDQGIPSGNAKEWTPTGWLFKEVEIHSFPDDYDSKIYNKQGEVIQTFERGFKDESPMYEEAEKQIKIMEEKIKGVLTQLDTYVAEHGEKITDNQPGLYQEILNIKKAKEQLDEFIQQLHETKKSNLEQTEQAKRKRQEEFLK